jgi:hypothetical protein
MHGAHTTPAQTEVDMLSISAGVRVVRILSDGGNRNKNKMTVEEIKVKYRNAKRRALYHSGLPGYSNRSSETGYKLREKYELAMCDCRRWEWELERAEGKKLHYDPKRKFQNNFFKRSDGETKGEGYENQGNEKNVDAVWVRRTTKKTEST